MTNSKIKNMSTNTLDKAVKIIIDHFKSPGAFITSMARNTDDLVCFEKRFTADDQEAKDRSGLHFFLLEILRSISVPWIEGNQRAMGEAIKDLWKYGGAEYFYHSLLRMHSAVMWYYTEYGISEDNINSIVNDFMALLAVACLLRDAEHIEEVRENKHLKKAA